MSKGLYNGMKILTMPDLLKRINDEYLKKQQEASIQQKANEEKLTADIREEEELTKTIDKEKKIAEKMEQEYSEIEINIETETRKQVEKGIVKEADVRAGRISLKEFNRIGKSDEQISKEIIEQSTEKLELALKAIRSKNLEILEIEKQRGECRNRIRGAILQPGIFMQQFLKGLSEFANEQVGGFMADTGGYRIELQQIERKLFLTQGKSLGGGQNWERLTVKEARKIQFDPILPIELIPKLKSELSRFKDDDIVTVFYYFKNKDVEVRPCFTARSKKNE